MKLIGLLVHSSGAPLVTSLLLSLARIMNLCGERITGVSVSTYIEDYRQQLVLWSGISALQLICLYLICLYPELVSTCNVH